MPKQILIDSFFGLVRTAIAQGTNLLDYYEESPEQGRTKGNIYRGVVKRVDGNIQAAFVRYGDGRDGFLPLRDADSVSAVGGTLRVGDPVLVQVVKDEVGDKGAALTAKLSLSGRYLVFMPGREGEGGISSRIGDDERSSLKKILGEMQIPEHGSVILRTAALNKGISELQADLDRLSESYREIMELFGKGKDPALLFREAHPALRYLREYYSADVARIWVNEDEVLEQCRQFFYLYEPKSAAKVTLSQDGPLMFQKLGLEAEVEKLSLRKVGLPSGANIVIDQTEALVAIDVNSAKAGGRGDDSHHQSGLEETVFAVNKEAAVEIARQLRLRDLGGIIVVDFIDMEEDRHRRQIEEIVRRSLASDKAKVKVFDISPLGTLQISRQRLRKAGPNFSKQACETCEGKGWHAHPAVGAFAVLRRMEERLLTKKSAGGLTVAVAYPVANHLLNDFREHILSMEKRFACAIRITALPDRTDEPVFGTPASGGDGERSRESAPRSRVVESNRATGEGGRRRRSRRGGRHGGEPQPSIRVEAPRNMDSTLPSQEGNERASVSGDKRGPARRRNARPSRSTQEAVPQPKVPQEPGPQSAPENSGRGRVGKDSIAGEDKTPARRRRAPAAASRPAKLADEERSDANRGKTGDRIKVEVITKEPKNRPMEANASATSQDAEAKRPRRRPRHRPRRVGP